MTGASPEFPEYAISFPSYVLTSTSGLEASRRAILTEIVDELTWNPDKYPSRTIPLGKDLFIYRHPEPGLEITYELDRERKVISILHVAAPKLEVRKSIFISYSHEDERWVFELKKWLQPLLERDLIEIWDDSEIEAGEVWNQRIEEALSSAKAVLLLVTQNFLSSAFIAEKELPLLLDRAASEGLQILWIAVGASTVEDTEIIKYQAVNDPAMPLDHLDPAQQDRAFLKIYQKLKEAVDSDSADHA